MLDVVAAWCGPCKVMDKTTFSDPAVVAWAKKNVVPARVDAEKGEGRRISARYQAFSFPTMLFLDGTGNEIDRLVGAFGPADFQRGVGGHPRRQDADPPGAREAQDVLERRRGALDRERAHGPPRPRATQARSSFGS